MTSNLPETTYMWREIHEQPEAIRRALMSTRDQVQTIVSEIAKRDIDMILLVARGSSDHAALYAQYLFQYLNGIPVALATPSIITLYGAQLRLQRALVIGVSQSGEGPDVVEVVAQARAAGALTVGVTNQEHSALAAAAHHALFCAAGPERSVAATKPILPPVPSWRNWRPCCQAVRLCMDLSITCQSWSQKLYAARPQWVAW